MMSLEEEYIDVVVAKTGVKTGTRKTHRDGDYHRAVHVWIYSESTNELLVQKRADCKDSWPGFWDVSCAAHISAGQSSLFTARRELQEELGVDLPEDAFEHLFVFLQECVINDGNYINNEFNDVYLVTTVAPISVEAFSLQESEVSAVKYISCEAYRSLLEKEDPDYVPYDVNGQYGELFKIITQRYKENMEERTLSLQRQLNRFAPIALGPELNGISDADIEALELILKASIIIDDIFHQQVSVSNPALRDWLKEHADSSPLDKLKWKYFAINKSPWSTLDENKAFLTTADSAIKLHSHATKSVPGWSGVEYKAAFPLKKQPGANFYPSDIDKLEFESWKDSLCEEKRKEAMGFFSVIKRHNRVNLDTQTDGCTDVSIHDLYCVPFSEEYKSHLTLASELLHKAGELTSSPSLKRLLHSKADAFLSNDYYDSDIAWMELASFEAYIGVRDDDATAKVKLFGDHLLVLEHNLPMNDTFKSKDVTAAPIRVINLLYNAGDKGTQAVAFNLPNDERIVKDRGTSMVMLKNISEAKFEHILLPIAKACISKEQQELVDFDSFLTFALCHECCHGIGPHSIVLPGGQKSTVRLELQELHSALEEAKADIVGLWALNFFVNQVSYPEHPCSSSGFFMMLKFFLSNSPFHGLSYP